MSMIRDWFSDLRDRFGAAPALRCAASGRVLKFSDLVSSQDEKVIVTQSPPTWEHVVEIFGAFAAGAVLVPLNPRGPKDVELPDLAAMDPGDTLIFTSGSSGMPKGVVIGLSAHLANARGSAERIPLGPGDEWLLNLPLHHVSGLSILFRCLDAGACVVVPDGKSISPTITHLSLVETQLARLVREEVSPASLKAVLVGGGPVSLELAIAAIHAGLPLHLTYGMTETASQATTSGRFTEPLDYVHSGKALPGREVLIAADGHIAVRGDVLARGWLDSSGALNPLADGDGWYRTNDLGKFDRNGNLIVLGRSDRVIISGGEKIHPETIERALMAQPTVQTAAVLTVPHAEYGQRPVVVVHGQWDESALGKSLGKIAMPDAFFPWPESVPVPDGKITEQLRGQLRQALGLPRPCESKSCDPPDYGRNERAT